MEGDDAAGGGVGLLDDAAGLRTVAHPADQIGGQARGLQLPKREGRRAAWVARETKPKVQPDGSLKFRRPPTRDGDEQSRAALLPERWAILGYVRGTGGRLVETFVEWTEPVADDLRLGIDPAMTEAWSEKDGSLPVDPGMAWMVDYPSAVDAGMARTIKLDDYPTARTEGLALLLVVGVSGLDPAEGAAALRTHLGNHNYGEGLAFVPQGTATNNTDEVDSPWSFRETDPEALLARELDGADLAEEPNHNARRLGKALGLPRDTLLDRLENANHDEETGAEAMNRALWPATLGQYFNVLLANRADERAIPTNAIADLKTRFIRDVRGGASLPSLRVGAQPYGVLPVRLSEQLDQWADASPWFEHVLHELRPTWREAASSRVPKMDPVLGATGGSVGNDPDSVLTELLSTLPHPKRFLLRELRDWRTKTYGMETDALGMLFGAILFPFLVLPDPTWDFEPLSVLGKWGWARAVLSDDQFAYQLPGGEISALDSTSLNGPDAQIDALKDLRGRLASLGVPADERGGAKAWINYMITQVEQHRDRQTPVPEIGGSSVDAAGIVSKRVDDPRLYFSIYGDDEETESFDRDLVRSPLSTHARYLKHLQGRVPEGIRGGVRGVTARPFDTSPTAPFSATQPSPGRVRAAPGLRAGMRRAEVRPRVDSAGVVGSLPPDFATSSPLLYQLLDSVVDDAGGPFPQAYKDALGDLADLPVDELELRLRETLGLASHRLDAYFTSAARKRLDELRSEQATGIQLAGFGWVQDLAPDAASARDSQGFIHAPSLQQATTAAILRSGWSAHGTEDDTSAMAVDLSGERVRLGAWLLDGVRQGQALGELLGYRFERRLQDDRLQVWIDPVRRAVLLDEGTKRGPRGPVDGLKLLDLWAKASSPTDLLSQVPAEQMPAGSSGVLRKRLDALSDALDAAGDAAITESVHQVAQGNMTRAAATLDAINQGDVEPPQLLGLRTPIGGAGVVTRVVALLGDETPAEGWNPDTARAVLDPALESFAGRLVGDATNVSCHVRTVDADGVEGPWTPVGMDALEISALDAVFEVPAAEPTGDTRWRRRVESHVRRGWARGADQTVTVEVDLTTADGDDLSFADFAEGARAARSLLASSRPLNAGDLALPDGETVPPPDGGDAWDRADDAANTLLGRARNLGRLLPLDEVTEEVPRPAGTAAPRRLQGLMFKLADFPLVGAVPSAGWTGDDDDVAALWAQAWSVYTAAMTRLDTLKALKVEWRKEDGGQPQTDPGILLKRARASLDLTLGRALPLLPRFEPRDATTFGDAFDRSLDLVEQDEGRIAAHLTQVARVRPDTARLEEARSLSELLLDETRLTLTVAQLPEVAGETWVAQSKPTPGTGGRVTWLAVDHGGIKAVQGKRAVGLMIDEWNERIPKTQQTTGVAFHFDAPASRAPQSMLLAVTPDERRGWNFDLVVETLLQTLENVEIRAVGARSLDAYGHHLPAIFPPERIHGSKAEE